MPSHSTKQAKTMSAIAHGWRPSGKAADIPVSVAKDFHAADAGSKYGRGMARGGLMPKMPRLRMPRSFGPPRIPHLKRLRINDSKHFQHLEHGGFINSPVPGRTDKHHVTVKSGSYVIPSNEVGAIGEGNSIAGADIIKKMFGYGSKFGPRLKIPKFADGGGVEEDDRVPIVVAGGEVIIPPDIVSRIGNGDLQKGHDALDGWVMEVRQKNIKRQKALKPPKGSDGK